MEESLQKRIAPKTIDEFIGQKHIVGEGRYLRKAIERGIIRSLLFWGPSGSGKSVLASIIASSLKAKVFKLNASVDGVGEFKSVRDYARKIFEKENIVVIIDEIHHFNKIQQDVLLPSIEKDEIVVIGITTENPFFYINKSLLSRFLMFEFKKFSDDELSQIIDRAIKFGYDGKINIEKGAREILIRYSDGDARRLLNIFEASVIVSKNNTVDENCIKEILQNRCVSYDKKYDEHYDVISAFIKSMRGTDPDATLYWLGKMIYAGEDPLFIARRIVICASEDVGLANPMALVVANSAFEAVKNIGMPEAKIILACAALYVCLSPKSNSAYLGIERAIKEVEEGPLRDVPLHLKNIKISNKNSKEYKYPHDYPNHYVEQEYMPDPKNFYIPSDMGNEAKIKKFLEKLKKDEKKA
jgi:putative ATPase